MLPTYPSFVKLELEELKADILDLCEVSLDYLREIAGDDVNTQRYQEREQYIEHSKKCITNIFNAMAMLHNGRQDVDNKMIDLMAEEQDMFDYENNRHVFCVSGTGRRSVVYLLRHTFWPISCVEKRKLTSFKLSTQSVVFVHNSLPTL